MSGLKLTQIHKQAIVEPQADGTWVLWNREKTKKLGTHPTAKAAYAQEYAIQKSQERKKPAKNKEAASREELIARRSCCGEKCRECPYEPKHTKGAVLIKPKDEDKPKVDNVLENMGKAARLRVAASTRAVFLLLVVLNLYCWCAAHGETVQLQWNPNPETDIAGYSLGYGTASGNYSESVTTSDTITEVTGLHVEETYYFAVKAINEAGLESEYSDEISYLVPGPAAPPATLISNVGWSVHRVSSEELAGQNGRATNGFDGNPNTMWHSEWKNNLALPPHEFVLDLGQAEEIKGFRYLPRQDGLAYGNFGSYEFYISNDGDNWGNAVASGPFTNDQNEKEVIFPDSRGRYVMLRAGGDAGGGVSASMAELNLLQGKVVVMPPPPLDMTGTTVRGFSSEETSRENTPAIFAIDGNLNTFWHSHWDASPPHYLTIKLPRNAMASALWYWPRQDGEANGVIVNYEIETSLDGLIWNKVSEGQWGTGSPKYAELVYDEARYVRLWTTDTFATVAQISIGGTWVPEPPPMQDVAPEWSLDLKTWNTEPSFEVPNAPKIFFRFKVVRPDGMLVIPAGSQ